MKLPWTLLLAGLLALSGLGCGSCKESAEEADAFVRDPDNQKCAVNDDCVVIEANCAPLDTAYCGQVALSRDAAATDEWQSIQDGLDACDANCEVCLALLLPQCSSDGFCRQSN